MNCSIMGAKEGGLWSLEIMGGMDSRCIKAVWNHLKSENIRSNLTNKPRMLRQEEFGGVWGMRVNEESSDEKEPPGLDCINYYPHNLR